MRQRRPWPRRHFLALDAVVGIESLSFSAGKKKYDGDKEQRKCKKRKKEKQDEEKKRVIRGLRPRRQTCAVYLEGWRLGRRLEGRSTLPEIIGLPIAYQGTSVGMQPAA